MFRIFIDEVGNHDLKSSGDPNHRYLGLTGVIMRLEYEANQFTAALNELKRTVFGTSAVVLHRRDIIDATHPPFDLLADPTARQRFDDLFLGLLESEPYRVFSVVIDKHEHQGKYAVWRFHPYHYCMTVLLERYALWLRRFGVGDVMVESRGRKENMQLERAFRRIYDQGTDHVRAAVFRERLSSRELKMKPKSANIAGLQVADLIANPSCRDLICEKLGQEMTAEFGRRVVQILKRNKYLKNPANGKIPGWGTKWLP